MAAPFDIWDQAQLTGVVNRPLTTVREDLQFLGDQIAPITPIQAMVAKLRVYDVVAFGKGQFKAPDATPALYRTSTSYTDIELELALLEEHHRLSEEDIRRLKSSDDTIVRTMGLDLTQRARVMQLRNERLTEWMRWQAFLTGKLLVSYPTDSQDLFVDFGIPASNFVTPSTLWSNTGSSDPLGDIITASNYLANRIGHYAAKVHMNLEVFQLLVKNSTIKNIVNFYSAGANSINLPRKDEMLKYLNQFIPELDFVLYDNGYRDQGVTGQGYPSTLTKYLPKNKVLITTDYSIDGQNIADTLDGQVIVGSDPTEDFGLAQGPQSEVLRDPIAKTTFLRQASARMPRLIFPDAFYVLTVQ